jgi:hypothetical protein
VLVLIVLVPVVVVMAVRRVVVMPMFVLMRVIVVMGMVKAVRRVVVMPMFVLMRMIVVMVVVMPIVGVRSLSVRRQASPEVVPNGSLLMLGELARALLAFTSQRSVLGITLAHDDDRGRVMSAWEASVCRALRASQRTAAMAAPKPLSMFTTVTPAAQLDSIPSSAAKPPSEAP